MPGRGVPEDDQRQVQAADRLGSAGRPAGAMAKSEPACCAAQAAAREIAPRVLIRELKALTEAGLIDRRDYGVVPPKVEYRLTRKGKSFVPVIAAIRDWGTRHLAQASIEMAAAE